MKKNDIPGQVVNAMMENDYFSQWLGIEVIAISEGNCTLQLTVRKEMLNGFGIAHGGIAFSLADSALAFASNSRNKKSLVLEASMAFTAPVKPGDILTASAVEQHLTRRTGNYQITVSNGNGETVALFRGIVFRKEDEWFPAPK
ncbi:MAG TPA: hydroxyphenylacetyl-CoA thioesterase PaaI [Bacteroidia bacterium]|nr:hydroxyphenylacetyl-CoA thioesterase PaaI [Bacteroidia bacterium]